MMDPRASDSRENYQQCVKCAFRVKEEGGYALTYGYMLPWCAMYPKKEAGREAKPKGVALNYKVCEKRKGEDPCEKYGFRPTGARYSVRAISGD